MKDALGLIEIQGLATAVLVADTMVKTANVTIIQIERARGHGWITVKITGDVGAVNAAVSAGKQIGETYHHYISSKVIPRPSDSVEKVFCQTAKKDGKPTNPPENTRVSAMNGEAALADTEIHAEMIPEADAPAESVAEQEENVQEPTVAVLQTEETVLPESAQEPDASPVQQEIPQEPEELPVQEEIIPFEPEAAPEPATEPLMEEEKPEEQPSVPSMSESTVFPVETTVPPEKQKADSVEKPPVEKKAAAGSTSATVKHTNSKKTAAKEKDPSKQPPRKPRGKKEK